MDRDTRGLQVSELLDIGDIPVPAETTAADQIRDSFPDDVAFHLAFLGVGQGGSRIAEAFHKIGYARAAALNTTHQDLRDIAIPDRHKLDLGGSGAGKDPEVGAAAVKERGEDIYDLMKRTWGGEVDYGLIAFGTGGGTGAGAYSKVVAVARQYLAETRRPVRVGAIVAMPKNAEGQRPARNTLRVFRDLVHQGLSPVIIVDNERIESLYPRLSAAAFNATANTSIANLLHLFNRLAAQPSPHTTFDRADFARLLDSGVVAFGAQKIEPHADEADISRAIRQQLRTNVLAAVDLTRGRLGGLIFVLGQGVFEALPEAFLDHGFEMLTRVLAPDSAVFRGVYPGKGNDLRAFTMIGGLSWPGDRLRELAQKNQIAAEGTAGLDS